MSDDEIMTKEEAVAFVGKLVASQLAGKDFAAAENIGRRYIRPDDLDDALYEAMHIIADHLDKASSKLSDDLEVQEAIRHRFDQTISETMLVIRVALERMKKPKD